MKKVAQLNYPKTQYFDLQVFFKEELKHIYWAENYLLRKFEKLTASATSPELIMAFSDYRKIIVQHIEKIEELFDALEIHVEGKRCSRIEEITTEIEQALNEMNNNAFTRDGILVIGGHKIQQYKIVVFEGLIQVANLLYENNIATGINEMLEEERTADKRFTEVIELYIQGEGVYA